VNAVIGWDPVIDMPGAGSVVGLGVRDGIADVAGNEGTPPEKAVPF